MSCSLLLGIRDVQLYIDSPCCWWDMMDTIYLCTVQHASLLICMHMCIIWNHGYYCQNLQYLYGYNKIIIATQVTNWCSIFLAFHDKYLFLTLLVAVGRNAPTAAPIAPPTATPGTAPIPKSGRPIAVPMAAPTAVPMVMLPPSSAAGSIRVLAYLAVVEQILHLTDSGFLLRADLTNFDWEGVVCWGSSQLVSLVLLLFSLV